MKTELQIHTHTYTHISVTLNVESLETAESSPMQYNNSSLKLSLLGKHSLYGKFTRW